MILKRRSALTKSPCMHAWPTRDFGGIDCNLEKPAREKVVKGNRGGRGRRGIVCNFGNAGLLLLLLLSEGG